MKEIQININPDKLTIKTANGDLLVYKSNEDFYWELRSTLIGWMPSDITGI